MRATAVRPAWPFAPKVLKISGKMRVASIPKVVVATKRNCSSMDNALSVVVVGGGIAGLLTAHVLADKVDRVTLIEKDLVETARVEDETFKETTRRRLGVPQITQPHQLVVGAVQALESLMPGFRCETIRQGGLDIDLGLHVRYFDYGAVYPQKPANLPGLGVSRRFLEQCIRERVYREGRELGTLEIQEGSRAVDFVWGPDGETVTGIRMKDGSEILADLVIDASGRASRTPEWLRRQGIADPPIVTVDPRVASASRMVKMPDDWSKQQDWLLLVCKSQPHGRRGGTLLPTEGDLWQVTLAEMGGDNAPMDDEAFMEFARSLPDPTLYETLKRCTPVSDVTRYMAMKNELLLYDKIRIPRGLLVIGDAVQRLNAIYGQGIGLSSQSALLLQGLLTRTLRDAADPRASLAGLGSSFQPKLAQALRPAWTLATKADLKYATTVTTGAGPVERPSALDQLLTDALLTKAQSDVHVYHRLLSVAHLTRPASSLLTDVRVLGPVAQEMFAQWRKKF